MNNNQSIGLKWHTIIHEQYKDTRLLTDEVTYLLLYKKTKNNRKADYDLFVFYVFSIHTFLRL